ncbi:MAG: hypothetical protein ABEH56_08490 [Salinirussus sp.]
MRSRGSDSGGAVRVAVVAAAGLLALGTWPAVASAHDVTGSRFDAPLPLPLVLAGAGATVGLTAAWLALTDRSPSGNGRVVVTIDPHAARWLRNGLRGGFLLGTLAALVAGFAGRQVAAENFATVFTWPVWFRGVALLAVLFGSPWRVLSPWRTVYRGLVRLEGRRLAVLGGYPAWLGTWPALVGFLVLIGVIENLTVVVRSPALTGVVVAIYASVMLGGAVLFGPAWFDRADPLGALYRLLGRSSGISVGREPTTGDATGAAVRIRLRAPWRGCLEPVAGQGSVVLAVAAVYTVSFDGFTDTELYQTVLFGVRDALGTGPPTSVALYLAGLAGFVAVFLAASLLVERIGRLSGPAASPTDGGRADWRRSTRAFAPTVLPIAAAYDVAHNYPYVVRSSARLVGIALESLTVDPLAWLPIPWFWGSQVLLIVVGHLVAVIAAHTVAVSRYGARSARRSHAPMVVLMIGYTVLSLWIVSRPAA